MKVVVLALLFLSLLITDCAGQNLSEKNTNTQTIITPTKPDGDYQAKLKAIETERQKLANKYRNSINKNEILEQTRQFLVFSIDQDIFPFWYGTDWDFYGTTQTPREGKIACGYFVTTVLRDVGIKLNRVSLAQQASEHIVKSLTTETFIKRFRNVTIEKFVENIKDFGEGLYIVGLDNHVGFILNNGNDIYFIHSSYVEPSEVIKEKALSSPILSSSKYRIVGNISADNNLLKKWLNQVNIPTVKR